MGKLKNTSTNNTYGGGKEQLYTSTSGKTYRIRNSSTNNVHGDGKEKIITEAGSSGDDFADFLIEYVPWWVWIIIVVVILIIQKTCF